MERDTIRKAISDKMNTGEAGIDLCFRQPKQGSTGIDLCFHQPKQGSTGIDLWLHQPKQGETILQEIAQKD